MKSQIGILGEDAFTAVIDAVIIVLQSGSFSNGPLIQMWRYIEGLRWFLLTLLPLIFLQRALHHELQVVLVLLIRRVDIALVVFSLLFLPGVLLHEVSHFIAAKLLRVPTRGFSLVPRRLDDGRLLMGYVETAPTDFIRDALIGAAPFLAGDCSWPTPGASGWAFYLCGWGLPAGNCLSPSRVCEPRCHALISGCGFT